MNKLEDAEASYKKAIILQEDMVDAHFNLGITLQELGRLEEAEKIYEKIILLKPDYAEAHNNLGITFEDLGRLDEAEESYKKAIYLEGDFGEAKVGVGRVLMLKGKHKEGLDQIRLGNGAIIFDHDNWLVIE
tara:strand:- start:255 stop:650 length:396 start_codon:yes stop_codon:yes gene_type:complete